SPFYEDLVVLNERLTSLDGLRNLVHLGGNLELVSNPALVDLSGLQGLQSIAGNVLFKGNPELARLGGLGNLTSIGGDLRFWRDDGDPGFSNSSLTSFAGLENLRSIGGGLDVVKSGPMRADGLDNLTSVGSIYFYSSELTNLRGLASLRSVRGVFAIFFNESLPNCEAEWLRDSVGTANIGGPVDVSNNSGAGTCP
ncbi:MAG TPA: hypothetical protein VMS65_10740, partial [Polyangiaceae bacterium]|nr:hypothetical protein [Polyangiaceae bacterium]